MAGPIRIAILADSKKAIGGLNDTGRAADGLGKKFRGASLAVAKYGAAGAALAAGAAVVGLAKLAAGAAEDEQAATLLAKALKNSAGATDAQVKATENYISKVGVATGITDDELRPALTKLAQATGSVSKAQAATTLATDIAAGSGAKLETVTKTLAKAYTTGSVGALSKYGVAAKNADGSTKTLAQATDELGKKFGGSAATKADTLQGKVDRLKLIVSEAGESIGYKLIPPLTKFAEFVINKGLPAAQRFASGLADTFGPIITKVGALFGPLITKVQGFLTGLGGGTSALSPLISTLQGFAGFVSSTVIPAVSSLASYLISTLGPIFTQVVGIVQTKVIPILASLGAFVTGQLLPAVAAIATKIANNLKPIFDQLATTLQTSVLPTVRDLLDKFREAQPTIQKVALVVVKLVGKFYEVTSAIAGKVLPIVIRLAGFLIANVVPAVASVVVALVKIIGKLVDFGAAVVNAVKKVAEFATKVGNKIADVVGFFADLPGKIKGAIGDAGKILLTIGGQIVDGLKNGISNAAGKVTDAVRAIVNKIPKKIREIMGIASPSKVTTILGQYIGAGLAKGLTDSEKKVTKAMEGVLSKAKTKLEQKVADFSTLSASVGSNLAGNLFGGFDTAASFVSNLTTVKGDLGKVISAFGVLRGYGLPSSFLAKLFADGGSALILDLAANKDQAVAASGLFNDINNLSGSLGNQVAEADIGGGFTLADIQATLKETNKLLSKVPEDTGSHVGKQVNSAAAKGQRSKPRSKR